MPPGEINRLPHEALSYGTGAADNRGDPPNLDCKRWPFRRRASASIGRELSLIPPSAAAARRLSSVLWPRPPGPDPGLPRAPVQPGRLPLQRFGEHRTRGQGAGWRGSGPPAALGDARPDVVPEQCADGLAGVPSGVSWPSILREPWLLGPDDPQRLRGRHGGDREPDAGQLPHAAAEPGRVPRRLHPRAEGHLPNQ